MTKEEVVEQQRRAGITFPSGGVGITYPSSGRSESECRVGFDPVEYLKGEVDRLQMLYDAERIENHRLKIAMARLNHAVGASLGILEVASRESVEGESFEAVADIINKEVAAAHSLVVPLAKE